ncbi:hypothetical protein [Snodgrassella sp. M0351]|uniref:hypothetical protein n=1 Tax=Snodgrassella sp. M0351 TaxID=2751012 RepID=UPI0018DE7F5B|nr:hypothetical protein [Snodgrassella sp. M0351]MBI0164409.1 hypothetical protein [Snodgrassella sp. M0351]
MNEQTSKYKPIGICPNCNHEVRAKISVKNNLRRDKCECPNCEETIYVCRNYGCRNYAVGGDYYDDEFCPTCAKELMKFAGKRAGKFADILITASATTLATALATAFIKKKA